MIMGFGLIGIVLFLSYQYFKKADMIPVLVYHRLYTENENIYKGQSDVITVEAFEKQMKWLQEEGYNTITLGELEDFLNGEREFPRKTVMIQFDDGRLSDYKYAYPILKKYNHHAIANIITSRTNRNDGEWDPSKHQFMNWNQIGQIKEVFELAGHTHDLHNMGADGKGDMLKETDEAIVADLIMNRDLLESPISFVYPFGHYTSHTIELVKEVGFRMAFTTKSGDVSPGDPIFELQRRGITPDVTMKEFKEMASPNTIRNKLLRIKRKLAM